MMVIAVVTLLVHRSGTHRQSSWHPCIRIMRMRFQPEVDRRVNNVEDQPEDRAKAQDCASRSAVASRPSRMCCSAHRGQSNINAKYPLAVGVQARFPRALRPSTRCRVAYSARQKPEHRTIATGGSFGLLGRLVSQPLSACSSVLPLVPDNVIQVKSQPSVSRRAYCQFTICPSHDDSVLLSSVFLTVTALFGSVSPGDGARPSGSIWKPPIASLAPVSARPELLKPSPVFTRRSGGPSPACLSQ